MRSGASSLYRLPIGVWASAARNETCQPFLPMKHMGTRMAEVLCARLAKRVYAVVAMKKWLVVALICGSTALFAKSKHAPLPASVLSAKTVYIANQTGYQGVADGAYAAFNKWGRYKVVSRRENADLVARFTSTMEYDRAGEVGATIPVISMSICPQGSDDPAFEDTPRSFGLHIERFGKAAVQDFRKRVQESQP